MFAYKFYNCFFSSSVKNAIENFDRGCFDSVDCLG